MKVKAHSVFTNTLIYSQIRAPFRPYALCKLSILLVASHLHIVSSKQQVEKYISFLCPSCVPNIKSFASL